MTVPRGSVLGVFGGGQLGRMFAQAAGQLGYPVHVYDPDPRAPAAAVSAQHTRAPYEDLESVRHFASAVEAVTYEFENIPPKSLDAISNAVPVRPDPHILFVTRNRLREKGFLKERGIPVTPFAPAHTPDEARAVMTASRGGVILKTTEWGYDGKGQVSVPNAPNADALPAAWDTLGRPQEVIVEQRIDLAAECSVLIARDAAGRHVLYGPFHNTHRNHILDTVTWTADEDTPLARRAREMGSTVADAFDLVGLLCVELFVARDGAVMVNEIAPRPHNSGHLTIEACSVSQFAQQALLTADHAAQPWSPIAPAAAMANLLGDLWADAEPDWSVLNDLPDVTLHLYGKAEARPGRKMGHLTALANTADEARERVLRARTRLAEK